MKKQILLILICLCNIFTVAYVNGQSDKMSFAIEKEIVSGNTQLLVKITITNNTTDTIMIPELSSSDEYGNPLEGGISNIRALAYNVNGVVIRESEEFDLIRIPFYSLKPFVKLHPGESYKHAYLLYAVYAQGPWSLFGIKPIPDLTELELKLHLVYVKIPTKEIITIDKVSNKLSIDQSEFNGQQPVVTIPPSGTMLGSVYLNAGLTNIDSKVTQNGTALKSAFLILNFKYSGFTYPVTTKWDVIGTVSSNVLPNSKYEWDMNYNGIVLTIVLQPVNGVGYISIIRKSGTVGPNTFNQDINYAFPYQIK